MSVLIVLGALIALMLAAYRGHSVILFAPLISGLAVVAVDPTLAAPMFAGLYMDKLAGFLKLYFPVFLLGAVFGKLIEVAGFSRAIVGAITRVAGDRYAMASLVAVCIVLTYGGISVFVVVFTVYPFAKDIFRRNDIPRRLIPGVIALGAFTFTMDALPGTPQIQNIIPTSFFGTTTWAAPVLGLCGAVFILALGMRYLQWRRGRALKNGEGYGAIDPAEASAIEHAPTPPVWKAVLPLLAMWAMNLWLTSAIPTWYDATTTFQPSAIAGATVAPVTVEIGKLAAIWAVTAGLMTGIALVVVLAGRAVLTRFAEAAKVGVAGALLAALNTASEYGFGAVIAALPGFRAVAGALHVIPDPLLRMAVMITVLAGITGSASGGLSITLAALGQEFLDAARSAGIAPEALHRIAAMASGGMDTLPHNGAVITLLAVTGLTHREAYIDIFAITLIKTLAAFAVVALFYATGWL